MSTTVKLDFSTGLIGLPVISNTDRISVGGPELASYEHWIFDKNTDSLSGLVNSRVLTSDNVAPSYSSNFLSLPLGTTNGTRGSLRSDIGLDSLNPISFSIVYRRPIGETGLFPFGGSENSTNGESFLSDVGFVSPGGPRIITRAYGATPSNFEEGEDYSDGSWVFVAVSYSSDRLSKTRIIGVNNNYYIQEFTYTSPPSNGVDLHVGNFAYPFGEASAVLHDFAEFIIFEDQLSQAELYNLYQRSVIRMNSIGVEL